MRVVVYVPVSLGAGRTRRAVERDVKRQGHEVVGYVRTPTEAQAAIDGGVAEKVAGRPEHLAATVPQFLPVPAGRGFPATPAVILAALAAWWVAHRRPAVVTGALVAAAAVATVALLLDSPQRPPFAQRQAPPTTSAPPEPPVTVVPPSPTQEPPVAPVGPPSPRPSTTIPPTPTPSPEPPPATVEPAPECLIDVELDLLSLLPVDLCVGQPNG